MTLTGHTMGVYKIAELSKNRLVSFSVDRSIRLWSLETGKCLKQIKVVFKIKDKKKIMLLHKLNHVFYKKIEFIRS